MDPNSFCLAIELHESNDRVLGSQKTCRGCPPSEVRQSRIELTTMDLHGLHESPKGLVMMGTTWQDFMDLYGHLIMVPPSSVCFLAI